MVKGNINWNKIIKTQTDEIIKCEIYNKDISKIESIKKELESLGELEVIDSSKGGLDLTLKNISKGTAVKYLAHHYNIKQDEIIAIGDSDNDIAMIEFAGLGAAMGNARESVKSKANYITSTNDQDGVAEVINKFVNNTPCGVEKEGVINK